MRTSKSLASISREMEEALLVACDDNDLVSAKTWIKLGANMNMICESGRTPLCAAAQAGHVEILQAMVDNAMRQDVAAAGSDEAQEYSTESEISTPDISDSDEDEIWLSEEDTSSGDSVHSEDSSYSRRSRRSRPPRRSRPFRRPRPSRRSVSSGRSESTSRSNSGSLSCHCNEAFPGDMCDNCVGNISPYNSDIDLGSIYGGGNPRRNKRTRRRSPDFENIGDFDDLNDGRTAPLDDSDTDESDCFIELYRHQVHEYFNDIEVLQLRRHMNSRNVIEERALANYVNGAAAANPVNDAAAMNPVNDAAAMNPVNDAAAVNPVNDAAAANPVNDAAIALGGLLAALGAAEVNPEDGAVKENAEDPNDEDDPEGGYVEVVEHVQNDLQDAIEYFPRGYVFGVFDSDDLNGLEVVSSSDDDSLVHYAFTFGRHGLMSGNPLYHASPWRTGIFSKTNCLTHRVPNPKSLNKKDHFGSRAIHYAIVGGHIDVLRILVTAGCKVNVGDEDKLFPLHMAAARDIPEEIDLLIGAGAHVNVKTVDKVTPLHVAASRGLLENVRILVENGARVNVFDKFNRSPLYMAVMTHHKDIVSYLLTKEAAVNIEEVHGYTPLFEALTQKNVAILRILAAAGANINQSPCLLHQAVLSRNETMVKEVLEAGCMVNAREENGDTALMVAARTMQPKMIRILLEYGAVVNVTNPHFGEGPLILMMKYIRGNSRCFRETFPLFLEHGLNLDCEMAYKCLQESIIHGEDSIGALLIRRGAIAFKNIPEIYSQLAADLFYEVVMRESWLLVKLFIYAGYHCKRSGWFARSSSIIVQWIENHKNNPLKLSELCRIVVRSKLNNKVFERVSFLNIPSSIQSYIKLENVT